MTVRRLLCLLWASALSSGCWADPFALDETPIDAGSYADEPPADGDAPGKLTLEIEDPAGDHTGLTDVLRMTMTFDPSSGAYSIVLVADSAAAFQDSLRVNVNLYNPEAGSFFSDTMNDFVFDGPVVELRLSGTRDALRSWQAGQAVYTNSLDGTPNPPGATLFRTSVTHFPMGFLDNEDVIAFEDRAAPAVLLRR